MKNRFSVIFLICAVLLAIFTTSCSSNKIKIASLENEYSSDGKLIINFYSSLDTPAFRDIIEYFNSSQDKYHIEVTVQNSYTATYEDGMEALRMGQQPHLLLLSSSDTANMMASKGIYREAAEILSKNGDTPSSYFAILPIIESYYSEKGKLQSFPFNSETPIVVYNRDMFRNAGINTDDIVFTFEAIESMLERLKAMGYIPLTASSTSEVFMESLSSMENTLFATHNNGLDNYKKARIKLSELHLRTFEYLEDFRTRGFYRYYGRGTTSQSHFVQGNAAIIIAPCSILSSVREAEYFDYVATYMPYFDEFINEPKNTMFSGASIWALEGFSKDVYTAISEFIKFVYSDSVMFEFHRSGGYIPITLGSYNYGLSQGYYDDYPYEQIAYLSLIKSSGQYSKGFRLGDYAQIRTAYEDTIELLFRAKATPLDAFDYYEDRANIILEKFEIDN